jgi:RNase adaptor protein for sRNA GlmZ degradation
MPKDGQPDPHRLLIGVVGPCGAGKSTLISGLEAAGFACRHIAQEHSYVPDMWKRLTNPDVLIFLQASFQTSTRRRDLHWIPADYEEEQRRLSHARQHADLLIETDDISADQVRLLALQFLNGMG